MADFFETYEDEDIDLITDYLFNVNVVRGIEKYVGEEELAKK